MKKIILSILLCINFISSKSQVLIPAGYQQGRDLYNRLAYSEAIPLLIKECIGNNNKFLDADIMLADCYRKTNQHRLAEGEYEIVCQDVRLKDNNQRLYYAQILKINQKYDKAAIWYSKYLEKSPNDRRAKNQLEACQNINNFDNNTKTYITNLPMNTNGYDYSPYIFKNILYYTSTGGKNTNNLKPKEINSWTGESYMNIYTVGMIENDSTANEYTLPVKLPAPINTKYNEGPLCFNKKNTKVYFTRNQYNPDDNKVKLEYSKNREANLSIYEANIENGKWTNIKELPFNNKQYSCGHPAWDEDNKTLYFSSTMPGGFGASDLWKVKLTDDKWEKPVNLGATFNTEGDEMFPTFDNDKTFYFSSDGLGGLGGLDIFSAKFVDGNLSNIHNMGKPINSSYDDFSYILNEDKTSGYFTSDRPGGKGEDDIYRFSNVEYRLDILVIDKFTKKPISTSKVLVKDGEKTRADLNSDNEGNSSTDVEAEITYNLMSNAPDYLPYTVSKYIPNTEKKPLNKVVIELQPIVLQLTVLNSVTKKPIEIATVSNTSPCNKERIINLTDSTGTIFYPVKDNCIYTLNASARSYLPKPAIQITTSLQDTVYAVIELEQITEKAITLNNIYYDFDKWFIRKEAEQDLNMLLDFIKTTPDAIIELSSHTDARGNDDYNLKLSQKRAQSAVDWLMARGVNGNNIKPVGYGENKPVNECVNNIQCNEEQHQRNRRTEFRVLNAGQVIASQVKQKITVNPCSNCPF